MNEDERDKRRSRLIARCVSDSGFKQKLLSDRAATLNAEGMEPADLSDEDLDKIAGGDFTGVTRDGG